MIISTEQAKLDTVLDPSKVSFLQGVMFPVTIQSYARDLLEARKLLKKAIDLLEYCNEDGINDFLERTREYAE